MAIRRSLDFLPEVFRTRTNERFLNATVDQLIQEPQMTRLSSFIGRAEGSSVYKDGDSYIQEGDALAQYYQLEPATVVRQRIYGVDKEFKISNVYNYLDMLNKVSAQGGIVNNHDRLFNTDYYNYTGFVDLEKLVNYSQYYWIPNGPDSVDVFSGNLEFQKTFNVVRPQPTEVNGTNYDSVVVGSPGYNISGFEATNPTITLVRGGLYEFNVFQPGIPFYIQTEPGISSQSSFQNNINIREVKGVVNNGEDSGTVIFRVPQTTEQNQFINMVEGNDIDFVIDIPYNEIHNVPVDEFYAKHTFDGVRRIELNKYIVLTNTNEQSWVPQGNFSKNDTEGYDSVEFDQGASVPLNQRTGLWLVTLNDDNLLQLAWQRDLTPNTKHFVREGIEYGGRYIYKDDFGVVNLLPTITANLDKLYYQDGSDPNIFGIINLVEQDAAVLKVDDILGKKYYTSPNGIVFTNGLKIKFNGFVVPESYNNKEYVVEGVGTAITLTRWTDLITPELFTLNVGSGYDADGEEYDVTNFDSTLNSPTSKEYIVINRSSKDGNPWSRVNRWFHKDVLNYTASILTPGIGYSFDENRRAKRPIIEFIPNLKLFNSGWNFLSTVSVLDDSQTDAFTVVEGSNEYYVDDVRLLTDVTVIFANDADIDVRSKIYKVERIQIVPDGPITNHLTPIMTAKDGDVIILTSGDTRQGLWYYWNGSTQAWVKCQQKVGINITPYFDLADKINNVSFADQNVYPSSNFQGSKLFSYKTGTGANDSELGFPISYKTIGNIGDIVFENNFDTDSFVYSVNNKDVVVKIQNGNAIEIRSDGFYKKNPWRKVQDKTKQYVERKFVANVNSRNDFDLDLTYVNSETEKNVYVYLNGNPTSNFQLLSNGITTLVRFENNLLVNDTVLIRIYGLPNDLRPIYTVPQNLEKNSQNNTFDSITLGQMRNHLIEIANNCLDFRGEAAGNNNLRDIDYTSVGGNILQHTAGFQIAQLMFNHPQTNIIDAINYSRREYNRFKERFLDLLENSQFSNINNPREIVDSLMSEITALADANKPFYYTDMLPFGKDYIKTSYNVFNPADRTYNTTNLYDYENGTSFYQNVLVYLNSEQLVKGKDYTVDGRVVTVLDTVNLQQDDLLEFFEYATSKGCMVPATPSKLGLFPAFIPTIYEDNTIIDTSVETKTVIQGHDGSITLAFNDFRDNVILEFERRVYNSIKVYNTEDSILNYRNVEPGAFRKTEYSLDEWTQLLSSSFLDWAGTNNVEIFSNTTTSNNLFSFNYSEAVDKLNGELLPGYWRAIYKYFYDTDRPHTHPWEMLGYSVKPDWWEFRYGAAPYTSGNLVLWEDLEAGLDFTDALNPVVKEKYKRPELTKIIPVDEHGELLPPQYTIVARYDSLKSTNKWRFGDQGPAESAWRRSSDYPFAVMIAYALAKPAEFCTYSYNTRDYAYDVYLEQVINTKTNNRKFISSYTHEGENVPGANVFVRDKIVSEGLDIDANLKNIIDDATINLSYKMSGYTDKKYIRILAEQSSPQSKSNSVLIPDNDYDVVLTKSAPIFKTTYSAVIVEKTSTGYIVTGFDRNKPYFKIIPSLVNTNNYAIKVGEDAATVYREADDKVLVIPYGTELTSKQQVSDFLISYGRYLTSQGFIFDGFMADKTTTKDWTLAVKEFLFWTQQAWDEKTIISLTPMGSVVKYDNRISVVDNISDSYNGSRVVDSNGVVLNRKDYRVYRNETTFELELNDENRGIHLVDIEAVQYEHTLVFNNITQFNDIVYEANLGNRQQRLKIVGSKTANWNGSLSAPGFLINHRPVDQWTQMMDYYKGDLVKHKNKFYSASKFIPGSDKFDQKEWYEIDRTLLDKKLIPTPTFNAQQFEDFYDVDRIDINTNADVQSRHATGFQPRKYFTDIGLDTVSQHKFYLGMIAEKGTRASINKFLRAKLPYVDNNITIDEEYAFRLGSYGSASNRNTVELSLQNIKLNNKVAIVEFLDKNDSRNNNWNTFKRNELLYVPTSFNKDIFAVNESNRKKIPTAGYSDLTEITATVFDINKINNISSLAGTMGEGSRIWVASDIDNDWNMYRVSNDEGLTATYVVSAGENSLTFTTSRPHGFSSRDNVLIKNARVDIVTDQGARVTNLSGVYRVISVTEKSFTVNVPFTSNINTKIRAMLFNLIPIRYNSRSEFALSRPYRGWKSNDRVYIDDVSGNWQVLENTDVWQYKDSLSPIDITTQDNFGGKIVLSYDERFMLASSEESFGKVYLYAQDEFNVWNLVEFTEAQDSYSEGFGKDISIAEDYTVAIGAPETDSSKGAVYIGKIINGAFEYTQVIYDSTIGATAGFGNNVKLSRDGKWLYITAPDDKEIHAYKLIETITDTLSYTSDGATLQYDVPSLVYTVGVSADQIKVFVNGDLLVPTLDYTTNLAGNQIVFSVAPNFDDIIKIEYSNYYQYVDVITNPGSLSNNFGSDIAVSNDGRYIISGAPTETVETYINAGVAYVYERSAESFIADGITDQFTTYFTPTEVSVFLDDTEYFDFTVVGNTITLADIPDISVIVKIETNNFILVEELSSPALQENMKFGSAVAICPTNCSLYIGAPEYVNPAGDSGAVYRFLNRARLYGGIVGSVSNPTVVPGDILRINNFQVVLTGTNLDSVISDINSTNIPGVLASKNDNNQIVITTDSLLTFNKLLIVSDSGTVLDDLGIMPYEYVQELSSPYAENLSRFGEKITTDFTGLKVLVGSTKASSVIDTTFDGKTTTYDSKSINFKDIVRRSGAAYVYEYQPSADETFADVGMFAYATKITKATLKKEDAFATGFAFGSRWLMLSSPNYTVGNNDKGAILQFFNQDNKDIWSVVREKPEDSDSSKISRAFIYNNSTNKIETELPVIDSIYGKVAPEVLNLINYKTNYDPAVYNQVPNTSSFTFDKRNAWGKEQVGKLWWDTNSLRYLDWNQKDLYNRAMNRDVLFPSSSIDIYQWVESLVPPATYSNVTYEGMFKPLYTVNEVFSQFNEVDSSGKNVTKYYYWVKLNKSNTQMQRDNNVIQYITSALTNIRSTGMPYISVIAPNAVALYNCESFIGSDRVLKIEYDKTQQNQLPVHTEWSIFNDGTRLGFAEEIYRKIQDSLAGQDVQGRLVPDPTLTEKQKYGLDIRPRQSVFADVYAARKLFHDFANNFLKQYPVVLLRETKTFLNEDPYPFSTEYDDSVGNDTELGYLNQVSYLNKIVLVKNDSSTGGWTLRKLINKLENGRSVLVWEVIKSQVYNNKLYWDYVDWYSYGYTAETIPTYQINYAYEISNLTLKNNDTVKILNSTDGGWQLVKVTNNTIELVGQQNATIQLKSSVYDTVNGGFGLDERSFESVGFAVDNNVEIRHLFDAFINMLIVNAGVYVDEFRQVYKDLINQYINLISTQFVETDWLFKTSFISIRQKVRNLEQIPVYTKQNETIVQDYINEIKPYHTKIRQYLNIYTGFDTAEFNATDFDLPPYYSQVEGIYKSPQLENPRDSEVFNYTPYKDWIDNYKYSIESIDILEPGFGYTNDDIVIISDDAGGFGAKARLKVKANGVISSIIIVDPGKDYTSTPTVTIQGLGRGAVLRARLTNRKVRTVHTTIKFDRYTYTNSIQDWQPNTTYFVDDLFVYNGLPFRVIEEFTSGETVDLTYVVNYRFYNWQPNYRYLAGDLIIKDWSTREYYEVIEDFTSGPIFTTNNLIEYTGDILDNAADRIWSYYTPAAGESGRDLAQLMKGIEYPGVKVTGQKFEQSPGFGVSNFDDVLYDDYEITSDGQVVLSQGTIDTIYYSDFTDNNLGVRPEDINTDGGGFVDVYSSHAPEELIPGRIFDAVDIKVTTLPARSDSEVYSPDLSLTGYYGFGDTTFKFNTNVVGTVEKLFVYTSDLGYLLEGTDYTIDWIDNTITLTDPEGLGVNDLLYILSMGSTGIGIVEDLEFVGDGGTTIFELANLKQGYVGQVYVKVDGVQVEDYQLLFNESDRAYIEFATAPAEDAYIQIHTYNIPADTKAYSSVKEVTYTISGGTEGDLAHADAYTLELPELMQYASPWDALLSVKLNGEELAPANNTYYESDGSTIIYAIPSTTLSSDATISNNDIVVVVNGIKQQINIDYILVRDGSSLPIVQFIIAPEAGAKITISDSSISDYRVVDEQNVLIKQRLTIKNGQPTDLVYGDKVTITQFSNHDMYDLQTKLYVGLLTETLLNNGFDIFGFDSTGFDSLTVNAVSYPLYELERPVTKFDNLWVYRNGERLDYLYDYTLDSPTRLLLNQSLAVTTSDVIIVRHFGEETRPISLKFRIFKDMLDDYKFLGIGRKHTTQLAQDLNIDDEVIYVEDASALSEGGITANNPGVVFINGERITYWHRDLETNSLHQIRRATGGTGAPAVHPRNSFVEDGSTSMNIPGVKTTVIEEQKFIGDGSTNTFILNFNAETNKSYVLINNRRLIPAVDYIIEGNELIFETAPQENVVVEVKLPITTEKLFYNVIPGGQIGQDGSTIEVATNGVGLQLENNAATEFLRSLDR